MPLPCIPWILSYWLHFLYSQLISVYVPWTHTDVKAKWLLTIAQQPDPKIQQVTKAVMNSQAANSFYLFMFQR